MAEGEGLTTGGGPRWDLLGSQDLQHPLPELAVLFLP